MSNLLPETLGILANLLSNRREIDPDNLTQTMHSLNLGRNRLGYSGFQIALKPGELAHSPGKSLLPWICLSAKDVEIATMLQRPMRGSPNLVASVMLGRPINFTEEDEKAVEIYDFHDEPWRDFVCNRFETFSKEARFFLLRCGDRTIGESIQEFMEEFINLKFFDVRNRNNFMKIGRESPPKGKHDSDPKIIFDDRFTTYATLEDEINTEFYIKPYLNGAERIWKCARECGECGNIFFYKQERAQYCSQKCRMAVANRKRRGNEK